MIVLVRTVVDVLAVVVDVNGFLIEEPRCTGTPTPDRVVRVVQEVHVVVIWIVVLSRKL